MKKAKRPDRRSKQPAEARVRLQGSARGVAILLPVLVAVLGFAAFYPALDAEFVNYDDDRLFVNNTSYRGFGSEQLAWMLSTTFMGHYQPLTWLSSALDYKISGTHPSSYHRNNLVLHALNGLLLYFIAIRLLEAGLKFKPGEFPIALRMAAAVAALLFAVHPLRVESVAWASERRDVLSVFFLLAALLAYLRAFPGGQTNPASLRWYLGSCILLSLSLLSKAWGMSFVVVVLILDMYPLRRLPAQPSAWPDQRFRMVWLQKLPYLMLGVFAAIKAGMAQRSALNTMKSLQEWGIVERLIQTFYGLSFYVWKTIYPTKLVALYELPHDLNPLEWRYVLHILAVVVGAVLLFILRRRLPALMAAAVTYVLIVAPVLGIAQSGPQFVADKYSYVSCIGWALVAGGGLLLFWRWISQSAARVCSGGLVVLLIAALFMQTWQQSKTWQDSETLWSHVLEVGWPSALAHNNYGILLRREGQIDQAIEHFREAIKLKPQDGNSWFALGNALKFKRDYVQAEQAYSEAVKFMTEKHKGYLNLGNMYYNNLNRIDDAIAAYRGAVDHMEAFRSKMFNPTAYLALGIALKKKGDLEGARQAFEEARRYPKTRKKALEELALLGSEN